jgi:hypothetical protein
MSQRAIGTTAVALVTVAMVVAGAASALFIMGQSGTNPTVVITVTTSPPKPATQGSGTATASVASETCYGGTLPTNSSSAVARAYSRTVFNITEEFDSWSWTSLSTFNVGSYSFVTTNPAAMPPTPGTTTSQLEPQLFFNVTNSKGQTQRTSVTDLGGWNGQTWPPDMSLQQTLFGGDVTIQWLFQCNSQNVFLEVTTGFATPTTTTNTTSTESGRSGPISTYPAAWSIYSSCPGFQHTGNTTTLSNLSTIAYPDSWNTTTVVTLSQVYQDIIGSSAFATISAGHGWVVYSWSFIQGGSTNMPPNSNDIVGYFILTNGASPNGYVTAYYNIQNGSVAVSALATTVTVSCPTFTTSSTAATFTSVT